MKHLLSFLFSLTLLLTFACSRDSVKSKHTGWVTAVTPYEEVEKLAKNKNNTAKLIGIVSAGNWQNQLALGTAGLIDDAYADVSENKEAMGYFYRWDYYFVDDVKNIKAAEKDFVVENKNVFGFRFFYDEKKDVARIRLLPSSVFQKQLKLKSNKGLETPQIDSDEIGKAAANDIAFRFTSLKSREYTKPRSISYITFALQAEETGPVWEMSMVFPDDLGWKYGAVSYLDGTTKKPVWEVQPFYIQTEHTSQQQSTKKVYTSEIKKRDFSSSESLLQQWISAAKEREKLSKE